MKSVFFVFALSFVAFLATDVTGSAVLNPIVFLPGWSLTKLSVEVQNGTVPGCPTSGNFTAVFAMPRDQNGFSEECMFKYLDVQRYEIGRRGSTHFRNRDDVKITIPGREKGDANLCVGGGAYDATFAYFRSKGYTIGGKNANFRAACWDWRIDPTNDLIPGPTFLQNTVNIIRHAYRSGGNRKVWIIAHSNGPMMALYVLNSVSQSFRERYIAGFVPLSGNFAGQGLFPAVALQGLSIVDFSFNKDLAFVYRNWTQAHFSWPQPEVYAGANQETILEVVGPQHLVLDVSYRSFDIVFSAIGDDWSRTHIRDYIGIINPSNPPFVFTQAYWGDGLDTAVGIKIDSFEENNILDFFIKPGDTNQEHVTNASPVAWETLMRPGCSVNKPQYGVSHFDLPTNVTVLDDIWNLISRPPPAVDCSPIDC